MTEYDGNTSRVSQWTTAHVNGTSIGYKVSGSGERTIVLIHG
jgi:hypothetical protein